MKIWLKMCLGGIAGIFLGMYLPDPAGDTGGFFVYLAELAVRIGRYVLVPMVFFGLTITVYDLRGESKLFAVCRKTALGAVFTSLGMVALGVIFVLFFSPGRIPIIIETHVPLEKPDIESLFLRIFPANLFTIFADSTDFLLPVIVFALLFGFTLTHERSLFHTIVEASDSLARIFYRMYSFISEFLFIGGIACAASLALRLRKVTDAALFRELFFVLGGGSLFIAFVIFPLLLYLLRGRKKPFLWIYAQLAPAVGALLSGDVYFSMGLAMRHAREVLGIPRKVTAFSYPFLAVFTRGGSAMITAMCFIMIFRSYSSLEMGFLQILWVIAVSFGISFLIGAVPGMGAFVGIAMISGMYGRGLEEGFLILRPVVVLLVSLGAFLDTVCASFVTALVSGSLGFTAEKKSRDLI
jgi:Na+/H+-dicarboxylate symporter